MDSALSMMIDNTNFVEVNLNLTNINYSDVIGYGYPFNYTENATKVVNYTRTYMKRDPLVVVIPMTILYGLIFVSGLLGNIITCIVIAKNRAMHTATNYYLFSLAVSDLLLLISGMPFEMYEIWFRFHPYPFGEDICILQGFAAETSANATVLTITAFTAERYIAICHPFLSHTMSKLSRAVKFILGIWLMAMGLAVPQILDLGIIDKFETCGPKNDERKYVFTISSVISFVLPMLIITVFYILIGLQLRRSRIVGRSTTANGSNSIRLKTKSRVPSKRHILVTLDTDEKTNPLLLPAQTQSLMEAVYTENKHENGQRVTSRCCEEGRKNYSQNRYQGSRHVINMLVAVVVAFFVCWAPHHAQRIFAMNAEQKHAAIYDIITPISGVLYYVSTCINPFLYNIMSHKFREAFKATCSRCFYHRGHSQFQSSGKLFRNISQRSISHSAHTCSSICSGQIMQQVNACILEQDMSLLKCTKRPLTVTFKKPVKYHHKTSQMDSLGYSYAAMNFSRPPSEVFTSQPHTFIRTSDNLSPVPLSFCKETSCNWKGQQNNAILQNEKGHIPIGSQKELPRTTQSISYELNLSMECQNSELHKTFKKPENSKRLADCLNSIIDDPKCQHITSKNLNKKFENQRLSRSRSLTSLAANNLERNK